MFNPLIIEFFGLNLPSAVWVRSPYQSNVTAVLEKNKNITDIPVDSVNRYIIQLIFSIIDLRNCEDIRELRWLYISSFTLSRFGAISVPVKRYCGAGEN